MEEVGLEQARKTLGRIVSRVHHTGKPTRITRQGEPAVVLVSDGWFKKAEALMSVHKENRL